MHECLQVFVRGTVWCNRCGAQLHRSYESCILKVAMGGVAGAGGAVPFLEAVHAGMRVLTTGHHRCDDLDIDVDAVGCLRFLDVLYAINGACLCRLSYLRNRTMCT